jgi:hypothetical protein
MLSSNQVNTECVSEFETSVLYSYIQENSNLYSSSSKNVVKGVIQIQFHADLICSHP